MPARKTQTDATSAFGRASRSQLTRWVDEHFDELSVVKGQDWVGPALKLKAMRIAMIGGKHPTPDALRKAYQRVAQKRAERAHHEARPALVIMPTAIAPAVTAGPAPEVQTDDDDPVPAFRPAKLR